MKQCTHDKQWHRISTLRALTLLNLNGQKNQGFALPMALILGLIMVTLMTASLLEAQSNRDSSKIRQSSGTSEITVDSAIARVLAELSKPENSELLGRNYDPINPNTGKTYLGDDRLVNSGDEAVTGVDQWSGFDRSALPCYQQQGISAPSINLSGSIGANAGYELLAYRYDPTLQEGTVLIQGNYGHLQSHVLLSISISQNLDNFPGIALIEKHPHDRYLTGVLGLRGRAILGKKGNVYIIPEGSADPTLTGWSAPDDSSRGDYLNSVWSSSLDGANTDTISGSIYACNLQINIPQGVTGTNFGVIRAGQRFPGVGGDVSTLYTIDGLELSGTDVLTLDTTGGPVVVEVSPVEFPGQRFSLRDYSKIVNVRTDGQPPKVGDARIIIRNNLSVDLYNQTCLSQVFLYSVKDELLLQTDGPGCPSGQNTNVEGVVWVEAILSSKNDVSNRNIRYLGNSNGSYDLTVTPGATSGIAVPDDVSSLVDLLQYTGLPLSYDYKDILTWQRVNL